MKALTAVNSIPVDVTNPGQFFACCGVLELASRVCPGTEACFREQRFELNTEVGPVLDTLFRCLTTVCIASTEEDAGKKGHASPKNPFRGRKFPIRLHHPFNLTLDWWTSEDSAGIKTWTAGQRVTDLFLDFVVARERVPSMRDHFQRVVEQWPDDWLRSTLPIAAPSSFSYDSRLARNRALDLGHTDCGTLAFSPAVDVLTVIGLQRFRPVSMEERGRNRYCTWREPLAIAVAAAAAQGLIDAVADRCFEFSIKARDSENRYKLFGHAQATRRTHG